MIILRLTAKKVGVNSNILSAYSVINNIEPQFNYL